MGKNLAGVLFVLLLLPTLAGCTITLPGIGIIIHVSWWIVLLIVILLLAILLQKR